MAFPPFSYGGIKPFNRVQWMNLVQRNGNHMPTTIEQFSPYSNSKQSKIDVDVRDA